MKKNVCLSLVIALVLLVFACSGGTSISIKTIEWEPDGSGFRQFKTNNPGYTDTTFWYYTDSSYQDPMTTVETEVVKMSGSASGGMGIMFCFQDHDNFYVFVCDIDGYYAVYERWSGSWWEIIDWLYSADLNTGYNVLNTLKVSYEDSTDTFTLYANGNLVDTFTDSDFSGGSSGYECHISGTEKFPVIPADFRFKQLLPGTDP